MFTFFLSKGVQETAWLNFSTFASVATGDHVWSTPSNAQTSNNSYATSTLSSADTSEYLHCTNCNPGIPSTSIISGIAMQFERSEGNTDPGVIFTNQITLIKGGSRVGSKNDSSVDWLLNDAYFSFGGSSDLWGQSFTPADVNATNFGVAIQAGCVGATVSEIARIDHVQVKIYYY